MFTLLMGIAGFIVGIVISALGGAWWIPFVGLGGGIMLGMIISESANSLKYISPKTEKVLIGLFGVLSLAVLAFVIYAFLSNYATIEEIFKGYFEDFSDTGIAYALLQLLFGFPIRVIIDMITAKEVTMLGWGLIVSAVYGAILVFFFAASGLAVSAEDKKGYYIVTRDANTGAEIARREANGDFLAFKENALIALLVFLVSVCIPFLPLAFGIGGTIGSLFGDEFGKPTLIICGVIAAILFIGFPLIGSALL